MRLAGRGVRCVRGGREVFAGLDFEAVSGEALAVTGPNGSGKTSLLRLIAGLLMPAGGAISPEEAVRYQDPYTPSITFDELGGHYSATWTRARDSSELIQRALPVRVAMRPSSEVASFR